MSAFTLENGRRLLLETADILDELGIRFFLIQGTALGAYRDHGFTPTEADIDFGVLVEHLYPKQLVDCLLYTSSLLSFSRRRLQPQGRPNQLLTRSSVIPTKDNAEDIRSPRRYCCFFTGFVFGGSDNSSETFG